MGKTKIELTRCVLYGEQHHLPGTVLDVPEEDVSHFLEKNVGKVLGAPAPSEPHATNLPRDAGGPPASSASTDTQETGSDEGNDEDPLLADLMTLPGVTEEIAQAFIGAGVSSKEQLGEYTAEELVTVEGVSQAVAEGIVAAFKAPAPSEPPAGKKGRKGKA